MAGRGRPKKDRTVLGGPGSAPPAASSKTTHNHTMSDDQLQKLTRDHMLKRQQLLAAEKEAKARRMNHDKVIKSDLGESGLDNIKLLERLSTPEGEKSFKEEMDRQAQVARWAGLQIGTQGTLFEEDRRPIVERAFEEGKRAGMDGKDCAPPHAAGTEAYAKWIEGWHAGQSVKLGGIKSSKKDVAEIIPPEVKESAGKPDDFDAAANGPEGTGQEDSGEAWPDDQQVGKVLEEKKDGGDQAGAL